MGNSEYYQRIDTVRLTDTGEPFGHHQEGFFTVFHGGICSEAYTGSGWRVFTHYPDAQTAIESLGIDFKKIHSSPEGADIKKRYANVEGKIAALISPCYGAGWSTWAEGDKKERLLFDPKLVEMALRKAEPDEVSVYMESVYPGQHVCILGWRDIEVTWVHSGDRISVREYDGYESLEYLSQEEGFNA